MNATPDTVYNCSHHLLNSFRTGQDPASPTPSPQPSRDHLPQPKLKFLVFRSTSLQPAHPKPPSTSPRCPLSKKAPPPPLPSWSATAAHGRPPPPPHPHPPRLAPSPPARRSLARRRCGAASSTRWGRARQAPPGTTRAAAPATGRVSVRCTMKDGLGLLRSGGLMSEGCCLYIFCFCFF